MQGTVDQRHAEPSSSSSFLSSLELSDTKVHEPVVVLQGTVILRHSESREPSRVDSSQLSLKVTEVPLLL